MFDFSPLYRRAALAAMGLVLLSAPMSASASNTATVPAGGSVHGVSWSERSTLPCTGATGTAALSVNITNHSVHTAAGLVSVFQFEGTDTFTPDNPLLPSYSGHATGVFQTTVSADQPIENKSMFHARLIGSDGSTINGQEVVHSTTFPDGNTTVSVDHFNVSCS